MKFSYYSDMSFDIFRSSKQEDSDPFISTETLQSALKRTYTDRITESRIHSFYSDLILDYLERVTNSYLF